MSKKRSKNSKIISEQNKYLERRIKYLENMLNHDMFQATITDLSNAKLSKEFYTKRANIYYRSLMEVKTTQNIFNNLQEEK